MRPNEYKFLWVVFLFSVFALLGGQVTVSADSGDKVLGTVSGTKGAALLTPFGSWMPVEGRLYPVVDGATVKSGEGLLSLQLKDSTKIEAGKHVDLSLKGTRGSYVVQLQKGSILFRVPQGASLVVMTPTATVEVPLAEGGTGKVAMTSATDRIGTVTFDGTRARVACLNGQFGLQNGPGSQQQTLSRGTAAFAAGADDSFRVELTQTGAGQNTDVRGLSSNLGFAAAAAASGVAVSTARTTSTPFYFVPAGTNLADADVGAHNISPRR